MSEKRILHIDMDAFFAAIEQAANPALRGKAVIVGGRANKERTVVCAASYEAKRRGVDSGMSCAEAFRLCPRAEFVVADSAKYIYISQEIALMLEKYSPRVERASIDEFYLDVTGCDRMFGSYKQLAMELKNDIKKRFNVTGSVGISVNRLISKMASKINKPDGLLILEKKDIYAALKDMSVEKITGIGPSLTRRLQELRIFTYADLAGRPKEFFISRFGKIGRWIYAAAHPEEDGQEITPYCRDHGPPKSMGHSYTLPGNIYRKEEIKAWIRLLCEMTAVRLRRANLEAAIMYLYLRKPDMGFISREKNFQEPVNDGEALYQRALFILETLKIRNMSVRALGVSTSRLSPAGKVSLFPDQEKRRRIIAAQDSINQRHGEWTVYPASIFYVK